MEYLFPVFLLTTVTGAVVYPFQDGLYQPPPLLEARQAGPAISTYYFSRGRPSNHGAPQPNVQLIPSFAQEASLNSPELSFVRKQPPTAQSVLNAQPSFVNDQMPIAIGQPSILNVQPSFVKNQPSILNSQPSFGNTQQSIFDSQTSFENVQPSIFNTQSFTRNQPFGKDHPSNVKYEPTHLDTQPLPFYNQPSPLYSQPSFVFTLPTMEYYLPFEDSPESSDFSKRSSFPSQEE
ncbi:uncharacterized protein LOC128982435 [Macrosteles quadrilineatus]|uniref:uncharacterized protein LOC128982435 n=1 Tax=Macrosteles quadrilineatus TaxID=74068 RepID=UPI0023E28C46|nr:uncharacterized protein LOC128982435 [Macrosteles quadrilineatus]